MASKKRLGWKVLIKPFLDEAHLKEGKDLPPVSEEELASFNRMDYKGFDRVGYARPLGGWFYQFFYAFAGSGILFLLVSFELGIMYPEPESRAYVDVAGVLFSILFFAFNVPTNFAIERWVSDYRVKNPRQMLQFISFYIWYQMTTGLVLITSTSLYVFWIVVEGRLAYVAWLMLVLITREYPACLHVFMRTIMGLQRFDYQSKIGFMEQIYQKGLEIGFVLWGRFILGSNPAIGALMGTAIGFVIGTYVDDFLTAILSGLYLRRELNRMGLSLKDALRPNFTWAIAKMSIIFGFKLSIPGIFNTVIGFFVFFTWYDAVPAYATYVVLNRLADQLANLSKSSAGIESTGAFGEAINNGKYRLAQYYIANTFKYYGFFTVGIGCLIIGFLPVVLNVMLVFGGAENYLLAIPFILPNILMTFTEQPARDGDRILTMGNKPLFKSFTSIVQEVLNIMFTFLWIFGLRLPQTYGVAAMIWLLPLGNVVGHATRMLLDWWYINRYICKVGETIKNIAWQAFIAPVIPGFVTIAMGYAWYLFVFPWLELGVGMVIAAIITVMFAFAVGLIFNFIILYGFFGGWDDHTLGVFKEAIYISGPSRILFVPVYKLTAALVKVSPFHNRFKMHHEDAEREMKELMIQRDKQTQLAKEGKI